MRKNVQKRHCPFFPTLFSGIFFVFFSYFFEARAKILGYQTLKSSFLGILLVGIKEGSSINSDPMFFGVAKNRSVNWMTLFVHHCVYCGIVARTMRITWSVLAIIDQRSALGWHRRDQTSAPRVRKEVHGILLRSRVARNIIFCSFAKPTGKSECEGKWTLGGFRFDPSIFLVSYWLPALLGKPVLYC
jgi:hypothetical protein